MGREKERKGRRKRYKRRGGETRREGSRKSQLEPRQVRGGNLCIHYFAVGISVFMQS